MVKKLFSLSALWLVVGCAVAMLILVLVYKMAYFAAFGIDGAYYVSISELFADMVEPWAIIISVVFILAFFSIWYNNLNLSSRPIGIITNSKWAAKERESRKRILERRAKLQEKGHVSLFDFFFVLVILVLCFYAVLKQHGEGGVMSMSQAVIWLLVPIGFYAAFNIGARGWAGIIGSSENPEETDMKVNKTIVSLIVPFFIYAVALFYINGFYCGESTKSSKQAGFVVVAMDGTSYADDLYVYVGQSNTEILLYNKTTSMTIILNKNKVDQIQIDMNSVYKTSLLREWMDKLVKK